MSALVLSLACWVPRIAAQLPSAFTPTGTMTAARAGHTATLLRNGKVLIAGESHFQPFVDAEILASAETLILLQVHSA